MSHRNRTRDFDNARIAKHGFLAGVLLFAVGAVGGVVGRSVVETLPDVVYQILFSMEVLGVLVALFVPILFGAVLPLIE